ncbi:hypothetical protein ARMGADRAFT_1020976 [Armillaria gallica]|uniref:Uncharacterized protein n=1 Tax=Armillaria gallica TaxID=47427 RepID=A0A2H3CM47_ARMGA|nr:hypothetical protein ARMGADRAFT_1020976 [Armillaria gallica]
MHQDFVIILILLFVTRACGAQTSPDNDKGVPACNGDQRTVWNITWSCLSTIFACTWLAVHPNVPGRNITTKGAISCAIEKVKIMAITILAPEVIVGWAAEQFTVAWKLCHGRYNICPRPWTEQKNEPKLTLAHGFLFSMGGFYYTAKYEIPHRAPDGHNTTSTPPLSSPPSSVHEGLSDLTTLLNDTPGWETVEFPGTIVTVEALESEPNLAKNLAAISPETIEDKSKADALSKTFSILQICWFIVQCIARALQHLPITLLEMTALAFAGLSIITYSLRWYKPLNVKYQISLDGSDCKPWLETNDPEESASPVSPSWAEWVKHRCFLLLHWMAHTSLGVSAAGGFCEDTGHAALRFYSGTRKEILNRLLTMVCVGSLFGTFHFLAWSFYFPSHAEMVLWQFSFIALLIGLFVGGHIRVGNIILNWVNPEWSSKTAAVFLCARRDDKTWFKILHLISLFMISVALVAYFVARIMLIILAFLQLRSLPPSAFCTIQWTTYIPHI